MHGSESISPWVARWSHLVPAGSTVLDVACGLGRHALHFYKLDHPVAAVDIAQAAIDEIAKKLPSSALLRVADIENGPWPFMQNGAPQQFGAVVVTNYLWRALLPTIVASVAPGGVLIYETFAHGNASVGKPSRPDFLLQPGELLAACAGLRVVAYEDGFLSAPERFVQRIVAVREALPAADESTPKSTADSTTDTTTDSKSASAAHQKSENPASISPPRYLL
jgi:SAM-dependent methyltransferase